MISLITQRVGRQLLPIRPPSVHKGRCGRVLVIAGSRGMMGASIFVAQGALNVGAGLVSLVVPQTQANLITKRAPLEVTFVGVDDDATGKISKKGVREVLHRIDTFRPDVIACGPGLGQSPSIRLLVLTLLREFHSALLLDADGLNVVKVKELKRGVRFPLVITPHEGELARLLGKSASEIRKNREFWVKETARITGHVCLLKGQGTLISNGIKIYKNTTGNSGMATGGMGDLLTGIIAGFWGQLSEKSVESGFHAAVLGAYVHGKAGDIAMGKMGGLSILPSALEKFLPMAIRTMRRQVK